MVNFAPDFLSITDDSGRHAGHSGASPHSETHYRIEMTSARFAGLSRIERHHLVNQVLEKEFASGLHAVQFVLKAPGE